MDLLFPKFYSSGLFVQAGQRSIIPLIQRCAGNNRQLATACHSEYEFGGLPATPHFRGEHSVGTKAQFGESLSDMPRLILAPRRDRWVSPPAESIRSIGFAFTMPHQKEPRFDIGCHLPSLSLASLKASISQAPQSVDHVPLEQVESHFLNGHSTKQPASDAKRFSQPVHEASLLAYDVEIGFRHALEPMLFEEIQNAQPTIGRIDDGHRFCRDFHSKGA
jgi:hypothetical protein